MKSATPVRALLLAAALAAAILVPAATHAQELEPRSYSNTPIGLNFLIAGYAYQTGDVATDPSLPLEDAKVHVHSAVLAYARSFELFGTSAKADVIVPYSWLDGTATFLGMPEARKVDGFADPRFRLQVNLYGAPALTLEEFDTYEQNVIIGATVQVQVPLGQYDDKRAVNIGSNRWVFKPEIGISKAFGPLILEVAPSVAIFTANDDFFGGKRREQDPVYAVQGHVVYRFGAPLWGSIDGTYYGGGRTTVDGVEKDDRQSNARVGLTLALSVSRHHSIKLYASKGAVTRIGGDFDLIGMALQYRWGGGL